MYIIYILICVFLSMNVCVHNIYICTIYYILKFSMIKFIYKLNLYYYKVLGYVKIM